MNLRLAKMPRYHSKDLTVMVLCMVPVAVLLNYMLYGAELFNSTGFFFGALVCTFISLAIFFNSCGFVAVQFRNRYPTEEELVKRILSCLGVFYLMSALYIYTLLMIYDRIILYGYTYHQTHFFYTYLAAIVINTFITFLMEAIYRFEQIRETTRQAEALKKQCRESKLLGLKSQVNPHFLFNSLNTLSSLIQEDSAKADAFLNHMSKVYRYLLTYRDEYLVSLRTELSFTRSFAYLLKQRHGDGFELEINTSAEHYPYMIAPLTLQVIIENAVHTNKTCKDCPLQIRIFLKDDQLLVRYPLQQKINATSDNNAFRNVMDKYQLLSPAPLRIDERNGFKEINIPLITQTESITV